MRIKTPGDAHTAGDNALERRSPARLFLLSLGLGVLLLVAAVVGLASLSGPRPSSGAQPTLVAMAEASPVVPATSQAQAGGSGPPVAEQAPGIAAEVIAQVNGRIVGRETLQVMLAADRAMADLLGQPLPSGDEVLDRLVNEELVWQAAQAAGVDLEEDRVAQALQDFLTARGRSMADLEQALAAHHLDLEGFTAYFGRLLLVDQFSRTQAQSQGLTVAEYLIQLQRDARISFGPAAEEALAQVQSSFSQPTPEAPAATPVPDMARGTDTGQYAPLFELPALNTPAADRLALDDLIGKPTLLSFWATGCPYCRRQTPVLVDAYGRYAEQGVQFVGINVGEDQEQVQSYITANGLPYPIALDVDGEVASRYGVRGIPVTYVLDAEGRVVARHLGQLSPEQVDSYLERLLMATRP